jgi:hypothetical protein
MGEGKLSKLTSKKKKKKKIQQNKKCRLASKFKPLGLKDIFFFHA